MNSEGNMAYTEWHNPPITKDNIGHCEYCGDEILIDDDSIVLEDNILLCEKCGFEAKQEKVEERAEERERMKEEKKMQQETQAEADFVQDLHGVWHKLN